MQSGNLEEAEKGFSEVVKLDPANVDARANVGAVQFLRNHWADAAETLRAVLRMQPTLWKSEAILGLSERRLGHESEAQELLEASIRHLPPNPFRVNVETELLESYYQGGDLDKAVDTLRLLESDSPLNADTLYMANRLYTDLASRALDSMLLVAPESARMHELLAQHLINRGSVREAIAQYRKALLADPKLPGIHYELGEAILQDSTSTENLEAAEKEFSAAIQQNPNDAKAIARLGTVSLLRADFRQAAEYFSQALQRAPNSALAEDGMGRALAHLGKPTEAVTYLESASRNDPLDSGVRYQLATLYRQLGRPTDADRELGQFRKLQEAAKERRAVFGELREKVAGDNKSSTEPKR